jgi:hypothetical protein
MSGYADSEKIQYALKTALYRTMQTSMSDSASVERSAPLRVFPNNIMKVNIIEAGKGDIGEDGTYVTGHATAGQTADLSDPESTVKNYKIICPVNNVITSITISALVGYGSQTKAQVDALPTSGQTYPLKQWFFRGHYSGSGEAAFNAANVTYDGLQLAWNSTTNNTTPSEADTVPHLKYYLQVQTNYTGVSHSSSTDNITYEHGLLKGLIGLDSNFVSTIMVTQGEGGPSSSASLGTSGSQAGDYWFTQPTAGILSFYGVTNKVDASTDLATANFATKFPMVSYVRYTGETGFGAGSGGGGGAAADPEQAVTEEPTWDSNALTLQGLGKWDDSGSDIYYDTGNVGIGAAAAAEARLYLEHDSKEVLRLYKKDAESYGSDTDGPSNSSHSPYQPKGTVVSISSVKDGTAQTNATFINMSAYNSSNGNSSVYLGNVAGNSNGAGNFVVGRRTGTTSFAESMRIKSDGNVGIGTKTPYAALSFGGVTDTEAANGKGILALNATSTGSYFYGLGIGSSGSNVHNTSGLCIWGGTEGSTPSNSNCHIFIKRSSGLVGIGTTTPASILHIKADMPLLTIESTSGDVNGRYAYIDFRDSGGQFAWVGDGSGGNKAFYIYASDGQPIALMGGNVGIGTASPSEKLHMSGSGNTTLKIVSTNASSPGIELIRTSLNHSTHHDSSIFGDDAWTDWKIYNNGSILQFQAGYRTATSGNHLSTSPQTLTTAMSINQYGNVGIGTTTPYTKLQIGGQENYPAYISNSEDALCVMHSTATSSTVLNDPQPCLILGRPGTSGQTQSSAAIFNIHRYEHNSVNARTQLSINLLHDGNATTNNVLVCRSNGNVGIGTTSPNCKLDVNGSIRGAYDSDTNSYFGRAFIGKITGLSDYTGFGHLDCAAANTDYAVMQSANGETFINAKSGQTIRFRIANSDQMRINSNGNVGIGTTSPQGQLSLYQSGDNGGELWFGNSNINGSTSKNYGKISFNTYLGGGVPYRNIGHIRCVPYGTNYGGDIIFHTHNDIYGGDDRMVIRGNGNVGIGTTSPDTMLHLKDDTTVLTLETTSGNVNQSYVYISFKDSAGEKAWIGDGSGSNNAFYVYASRGQNIALMNGNVGIGTTSPEHNLQVAKVSPGNNITLSDALTSIVANVEPNYGKYGLYFGVHASNGWSWIQTGRSGTSNLSPTGEQFNLILQPTAGNVGIGTTIPKSQLHISRPYSGSTHYGLQVGRTDDWSSAEFSSVYTTIIYDAIDTVNNTDAGGVWSNCGAGTMYLQYYSRGDIWMCKNGGNVKFGSSGSVVHSSDRRIKKNIVDVPDNLALQLVRDIPCRYYNYIDEKSNGSEKTIGFIAQEVKEVFPMAVLTNDKFIIPNEMRNLENISWEEIQDGSNNKYKLTCDLQNVSGIKYELIGSNDDNDKRHYEIIGNSDNTFTFEKKWDNVFCYGNEIDDFHTIDKIKIFTLHHSAIQEIDCIQQADKAEIAELKTEVATLKAELAAIKAHLGI